jgi:hypothetical protein
LTNKYTKLSLDAGSKAYSEYIDKICGKHTHLHQYPELVNASIMYFMDLLQLDRANWLVETQISMMEMIKAWIYPSYYCLKTLAETVGREDAVKLYKRFITLYHIDHPSPNRESFVSLEKRFSDRTSGDTGSSEWVTVHGMLEDGKYAFKNKNCPTCADTTVELPDVEFKYLVCCYGDYEAFRANTNEHIVLTMEHTIIQGDPYCSRVLHDTRIDYNLHHPPREFWDKFEPGNEEAALKLLEKST